MARVLTNNSSFQYAIQDGFDDLGGSPTWFLLEPNGGITWGADVAKVARNPISKKRQRRKPTIVDLTSEVGFETDLTLDAFTDFIEGFMFATATNSDLLFRNAAATSSGYTIPSASAAQAAKLQFTSGGPISLVYASGYVTSGNNGLKPLSADVAATDTTIQVAGNTAETPPTKAEVAIAGIRAEAGDLAMTVSSGVGTLTSGNNSAVNNIDFTTLGLTVGQYIHIGGTSGSQQPFSAASTNTYGFARIKSIAAGTVTLDKLQQANTEAGLPALVAFDGTDDNSGGTAVVVDILFGRFIRNVSTDDADYLERYFQFEAEFPNLFETTPATPVAEPDGYEYALDNLCDSMAVNLPLNNKATITYGFRGTDTETPVDGGSRKTNASSGVDPLHTGAFNTTSHYSRLRITDVDESGLTTDFKDYSITLGNAVSPENVQGKLGAKFMNVGNFTVDFDGQIVFTEPTVKNRIRNGTTVTYDAILENGDGSIALDIPSLELEGGGLDFPENASVLMNLSGIAFEDDTLGYSLGVSLFPVTPQTSS